MGTSSLSQRDTYPGYSAAQLLDPPLEDLTARAAYRVGHHEHLHAAWSCQLSLLCLPYISPHSLHVVLLEANLGQCVQQCKW